MPFHLRIIRQQIGYHVIFIVLIDTGDYKQKRPQTFKKSPQKHGLHNIQIVASAKREENTSDSGRLLHNGAVHKVAQLTDRYEVAYKYADHNGNSHYNENNP